MNKSKETEGAYRCGNLEDASRCDYMIAHGKDGEWVMNKQGAENREAMDLILNLPYLWRGPLMEVFDRQIRHCPNEATKKLKKFDLITDRQTCEGCINMTRAMMDDHQFQFFLREELQNDGVIPRKNDLYAVRIDHITEDGIEFYDRCSSCMPEGNFSGRMLFIYREDKIHILYQLYEPGNRGEVYHQHLLGEKFAGLRPFGPENFGGCLVSGVKGKEKYHVSLYRDSGLYGPVTNKRSLFKLVKRALIEELSARLSRTVQLKYDKLN